MVGKSLTRRYVYPVVTPSSMLWAARALWLILPFTAGPLFAAALDDTDRPFQLATSIGLWAIWGVVLVALMVPRTQTLTLVRIVAPSGFVAAVWAALAAQDASTVTASVGLATTGLAALVALSAPVGDALVDGSSYGDESRFLLRTPGALLMGCLLYTSPSPRDATLSRMPSSA